MADQGERGWRASVTSNGRGLTRVSPRPARSPVSDSFRQIPSKSGLFRLSGTVNWSASTYLAIAAEADRQLIRKVTVSCRSGSALSTRSGSNDTLSHNSNLIGTNQTVIIQYLCHKQEILNSISFCSRWIVSPTSPILAKIGYVSSRS